MPATRRFRDARRVRSRAVLVAIGIDPEGKRSVLGVSVSLSEAEVHWRDFLAGLQARGLHGVKLVASATPTAGWKPALDARLTGVPWQRCQFHLMKNALAYVPRAEMQAEVVADLRAIFDAPDRPEAERRLGSAVEKYRTSAPRLADWLEANFPEGLSVFALARSHRRRLEDLEHAGAAQRVSSKRRTPEWPGCSPNDASLLRLVSAVPMEVSEDWETNRKYLTMGPACPA